MVGRLIETRTSSPILTRSSSRWWALGSGVLAGFIFQKREAVTLQIRFDTFADAQGRSYEFVTPGLSPLALFDADVYGRISP